MADREAELRDLADRLREHDAVEDAWLAKSFTDRLFVVDLRPDASLPGEVAALLADHDLRGYNEVHDVDGDDGSYAGAVAGVERHQFVDLRTRGEHQSYVVD